MAQSQMPIPGQVVYIQDSVLPGLNTVEEGTEVVVGRNTTGARNANVDAIQVMVVVRETSCL